MLMRTNLVDLLTFSFDDLEETWGWIILKLKSENKIKLRKIFNTWTCTVDVLTTSSTCRMQASFGLGLAYTRLA